MDDIGRERIAGALRQLADDLGAERARVSALRRENRELRAELERLRGIVDCHRAEPAGIVSLGENVRRLRTP